jgi:uncharacterized protein (DUF2225 family)
MSKLSEMWSWQHPMLLSTKVVPKCYYVSMLSSKRNIQHSLLLEVTERRDCCLTRG